MRLTLFFILLLIGTYGRGQNMVIDGAPVLLPRLTTAERDMVNGQDGMIIFNTSDSKFQGYAGGGSAIQSIPPETGMQYDLSNYAIEFTPQASGLLQSIELYYEGAGATGSLEIRSTDPCIEPTVLRISNSVSTSPGWNTYNFAPAITVNSGNQYYILTSSGTVTGSPSQVDSPLFQAMLTNNCTVQPTEIAIKVNLQGAWVNLH